MNEFFYLVLDLVCVAELHSQIPVDMYFLPRSHQDSYPDMVVEDLHKFAYFGTVIISKKN